MGGEIQHGGNRVFSSVIEFMSAQASSSLDRYDSLVVKGPYSDGKLFLVRHIPVHTTAAELGHIVLERHETFALKLRLGLLCFAVYMPERYKGGSGREGMLEPEESLRDAGVREGDYLQVALLPTAGLSWLDVGSFLEAAAASGVIGGLAYDLLKSTIMSTARRWQGKQQLEVMDPALNEVEAVSIARACVCLYFGIEDPQKLIASLVQCDAPGSQWTVSFRNHGFDGLGKMEVRVKVSSPEPKDAQILIVPSLW